jgi:hypothetical protein
MNRSLSWAFGIAAVAGLALALYQAIVGGGDRPAHEGAAAPRVRFDPVLGFTVLPKESRVEAKGAHK